MIKQFFKDTAIYGLTNILARGLSFLLLPLYTRIFTPNDYGVIDILTLLTTLINLTVPLEISQGAARYYSETQSVEQKNAYASASLWFTLGAYSLFLLLTLPQSQILSQWILGDNQYQPVLSAALIALFLSGLLYLTQNQLRWQLQAKDYAATNLLYSLITPASVAIFALGLHQGILSIFYANILASASALLLSLYHTRHTYEFQFDGAKCREMLAFSAPLVLSSISVFVSLYIDRIALQQLMSLREVGLYGVGYRFASIATLLISGFQSALTPLIYNRYHEKQTPADIAQIFTIFLTLTLSLILFFSLFSSEILRLLTPPSYHSAHTIIPILSAAIILANLYIFTPGLGIAKKTGITALINIITALSNTLLNLILIPHWGIIGAALATLISSLLAFSLYLRESQKIYPIPYPFLKITKAALFIIITLPLSLTLNNIPINAIFLLILKTGILITGAFYLLSQLIGIQKTLQFLQQLKPN